MTAAAIPADVVPPRRAWRILLWLVPLTALWLALVYALPGLDAIGFWLLANRLAIHTAVAIGLWLGLERTDLSLRQRLMVWLTVMITFTLWYAMILSAAVAGVFRTGVFPPRLPLAVIGALLAFMPLLLASRRIGQLLDAMPASWLVGLQVYRLHGGFILVAWVLNQTPGILALPGGIGDLATGLLALPTAIALASGSAAGRRTAMAWNIFGLLDFVVVIGIGAIITPGPFQLIVPSISNSTIGLFPLAVIPAFTVPCGILLHALSLRQVIRRSAA